MSRSESNWQELAGLAVSQLPICQLASGGLEEKCCINCAALCRRTRLVSRSRGVSTPLGRNREKKLSRLVSACPAAAATAGESGQELRVGVSGSPNGIVHLSTMWREEGRFQSASSTVSAPVQLCMQMPGFLEMNWCGFSDKFSLRS